MLLATPQFEVWTSFIALVVQRLFKNSGHTYIFPSTSEVVSLAVRTLLLLWLCELRALDTAQCNTIQWWTDSRWSGPERSKAGCHSHSALGLQGLRVFHALPPQPPPPTPPPHYIHASTLSQPMEHFFLFFWMGKGDWSEERERRESLQVVSGGLARRWELRQVEIFNIDRRDGTVEEEERCSSISL